MKENPRRKNTRLRGYDYSSSGYYFITICSNKRLNRFSQIVGAQLACAFPEKSIELTKIGQIISHQWKTIPNQYDKIEIDQFVVMPNHIHCILIIRDQAEASSAPTVSQIIQSFKSKSSVEYLKYIKNNRLNISGKIWQRSFYDHIIRDDKSLNKIREYIINNPYTWDEDENNLKK